MKYVAAVTCVWVCVIIAADLHCVCLASDMPKATEAAITDEPQARAAPVNYIIGRDGTVASAWRGYEKSRAQGLETLTRMRLRMENQ